MRITSLTRLLTLATLASTLHAQAPAAAPHDPWYNHAVVYEIYPRSFQDSNADGIGDLNGITQRLPYLEHLGIDAIWIAPLYPSPQVDFGYDISNYESVDPQYGTLADFDRLIATARQHHIRIIMDMVLNHTSDKHPWFTESASSRINPKSDWYIWDDGKPTTDPHALNAHKGPYGWVVPPNNWSSLFQGSAWEWVEARHQFYYHFFYKQQPDLNWRNPAVEKAMFDSMRFWLDRGVAGFRLDAITTLFEVPNLQDEPLTGKLDPSGFPESNHTLTSGLPEVHTVLQRLRTLVDSYSPDSYPGRRVLIGEIYTANTGELRTWYGTSEHPELQLPMDTLVGFHPEGDGITQAPNVALNLPHFRKYLTESNTDLDNHIPLLVFDNHDNTRSWDRFITADETAEDKKKIARIIAAILYTSHAAALTYYGAELGMTTHVPIRVEDVRDPIGITGWPKEKGRDGERTPMQWAPVPQAGFSTDANTWLPVGDDYKTVNAETEAADPNSLLNWNRMLIAIRHDNATMRDGSTIMLDPTNPSVLSYIRTAQPNSRPLIISINMSAQPQTIHLDLSPAHITSTHIKTLLADSPELNNITTTNNITLPPYASLIAEVQ